MLHIWGRGELHIGLWWGNLWERDHLEDGGVDGMMILKMDLKEIWWEDVD